MVGRFEVQEALFPSLPAEQPNTTNFVNNMQLPVHRWFRYSAGFSAEWVHRTLNELGDPTRMRVLDPFAGSGTTLLAAQFVGAESLGIDSHPFVSRVGQAKMLWTANHVEFRQRASDLLEMSTRSTAIASGNLPPLLESCYTPDVLCDLLRLRNAVTQSGVTSDIGKLIWLAFVSIVRRVSYVGTAQWQYVLPKKRKSASPGVRQAFLDQIDSMAVDMSWRQEWCLSPRPTDYRQADARSSASVPEGWATHVICSPPYANNYDYADATRLEQTVLGEIAGWGDLKEVRKHLIHSCSQHMTGFDSSQALNDPLLGAIIDELRAVYESLETERAGHGGRKAYHSMVLAYFQDLSQIWCALRTACEPGARICFVVGDSAPYGIHVPVEKWLGELAVAAGFRSWRFEKVRDRNLKWKNRKHRVPLHEGRLWVEG